MILRRPFFSFLLLALLHSAAAAAPLQVVASIKPVQLLVAAVGGEAVDAQLLLDPSQSPHHYQLRPSERRLLQQADGVVWVGPSLETFLEKTLSQLPPAVAVKALHRGHYAAVGGHGHTHEHEEDAHIWLSPVQAVAMARDIASLLAQLRPAAAGHFEQRVEHFSAQMQQLDRRLTTLLAPYRERGFIVLHPAYDYFVEHYGLNQVGAITASPELPSGAAQIRDLRNKVRAGKVVCVFHEPQFQPALVATVVGDSDVVVAELDPLAGGFAVTADAFIEFFEQFGQGLARCLEAAAE